MNRRRSSSTALDAPLPSSTVRRCLTFTDRRRTPLGGILGLDQGLAGELGEVPTLGARRVGPPAFLPRCQSSHVRRRVEERRQGREWNRTSVPACGTACSVRADLGVRPCQRARRGAPSLPLAGDRRYLARSAAKARGCIFGSPQGSLRVCLQRSPGTQPWSPPLTGISFARTGQSRSAGVSRSRALISRATPRVRSGA